jgi:hypothetical protein
MCEALRRALTFLLRQCDRRCAAIFDSIKFDSEIPLLHCNIFDRIVVWQCK